MAMRDLKYYHTLLNRWRPHLEDFMRDGQSGTSGAPWVFVQACDELVSEVERLRRDLADTKRMLPTCMRRHITVAEKEEETDGP